ncbi:HNH endonuclease [Pengzhenrongella sicca]|uniref:HNH endonuclease n=1 Tax=Pengzhenrongella sicca TaxID=2819238 RepID=A0A8A4ZHL8_9MICO|nr:HNH endonuclease [Pengzhenrongella sicca]QTE30026.1 HNH endonuclease [Pengzhenrongella sicca]
MATFDERTFLMDSITNLLGIPHDPKGVGSSVHNSWVKPVCLAVGIDPYDHANKYRRFQALLELFGQVYDPHSDTSEGAPKGGGTITNRGLDKLYLGMRLDRDLASDGVTPVMSGVPTEDDLANDDEPDTMLDARIRVQAEIAVRGGQARFRKLIVGAYGARCAVTNCDALPVLEAAHITPYRGPHTNVVRNGLLLRADVHTLFDLGGLGINPDDGDRVVIARHLRETAYGPLHGRRITIPENPALQPSEPLLRRHGRLYDLW